MCHFGKCLWRSEFQYFFPYSSSVTKRRVSALLYSYGCWTNLQVYHRRWSHWSIPTFQYFVAIYLTGCSILMVCTLVIMFTIRSKWSWCLESLGRNYACLLGEWMSQSLHSTLWSKSTDIGLNACFTICFNRELYLWSWSCVRNLARMMWASVEHATFHCDNFVVRLPDITEAYVTKWLHWYTLANS